MPLPHELGWAIDAAENEELVTRQYEQHVTIDRHTLHVLLSGARRLQGIQVAWLVPGPMPSLHERARRATARRWPALVRAIKRSLD